MRTHTKDYYQILGVTKDSTKEEIKRAYRALVKQYHPDNYVNNPLADLAEEKLKEINEAYDYLMGNYSADNDKYKNNYYRGENDRGIELSRLEREIELCLGNRLWKEVLIIADQMMILEPEYINAYIYRGIAFGQLNRDFEAVSSFQKAENMGWNIVENPDIYFSKAVSQINMGKYGEAILTIERLIGFAGEVPNYIAHLAYCYESVNDITKAEIYWNKLKSIDPNNELLRQRQIYAQQAKANALDTAGGICIICMILECIFDCC